MAIDQSSVGTDLGNGWYRYEKEVTMKGNQSNIIICSDGATEFYIDDISLVPVNGEENLIPDGGFEEVTVIPPVIPDYEVFEPVLKLGTQNADSVSAVGNYTVLVNAKNNAVTDGLPLEVLVAVFDSTGEMLNLYSGTPESKTVAMTAPNDADTVIPVPFEITSEGCVAEVYVINNRQKLDVYYDPVTY